MCVVSPRSDFVHCFSDAMDTDDKAGSSPAGKAADVVIMIIKVLWTIMHIWKFSEWQA